MTDKPLSEKHIDLCIEAKNTDKFIGYNDVKEAVEKLKEELKFILNYMGDVEPVIDEIFGEFK